MKPGGFAFQIAHVSGRNQYLLSPRDFSKKPKEEVKPGLEIKDSLSDVALISTTFMAVLNPYSTTSHGGGAVMFSERSQSSRDN